MICLVLREGWHSIISSTTDEPVEDRGTSWRSAGRSRLVALARRRRQLPGHLAGASSRSLTTAALPQHHHHRAASLSSACPPPPATSLGPAAFCDALSCSSPSPLCPPSLTYARRPRRRSTRHARPGIVGTSRTYIHCRSANVRHRTTSTRCRYSCTERLALTCLFAGHLNIGLLHPLPPRNHHSRGCDGH